ncbi:MAG: hypothetical protein R3C59_23230 [Planctomycetaceae bacterium]
MARSLSKEFDESTSTTRSRDCRKWAERSTPDIGSDFQDLRSGLLLDETGNWEGFKQDDNGNGTWDLNQSRTSKQRE